MTQKYWHTLDNCRPRRHAPFVAALLIIGLSGCGDGRPEGTKTYPISGNVTWKGTPVPRGTISIEPDANQGATGTALKMEIVDGRYASSSGQGTTGGPVTVLIEGRDGIDPKDPSGMMDPRGKEIFPMYRSQVVLPKEENTLDFEIPTSSAKK